MDRQHDEHHRPRGRVVPAQPTGSTPGAPPDAQVERLRQLCRDPTTPLQRIDAAYVETIKPELAARAWELYQQYGRGVIVIDFGTTDLRHMASDDVIHSYYVSEALRRKLGLVCPAALRNALQDYDPQHEMLIVVHHATAPHFFRLNRFDQRE